MSTKNDGGPAFPSRYREFSGVSETHEYVFDPGMTLRDWFAGQALSGFMSDPHNTADAQTNANAAYAVADCMLKVREAK